MLLSSVTRAREQFIKHFGYDESNIILGQF